jgi:phosphoglycerate dehydrogenase-like enzyme
MLMGDADAAIVSTDPFTAEVIAGNPKLRIIARVGVGTDSIDHAAAAEHGVAISITPGMNAETVADQTLALILALVRKVVAQDASVKAGKWERVGALTPGELFGKTVGLVGAGTIGRAVMRRLSGFSVRTLFYDEYIPSLEGAEKATSLEDLLARSDVVSLHAPLTAETRGFIGAKALKAMKASAFLINTSRGPLVDQDALFDALRRGEIAGTGLDVFAEEPPGAATLEGVPNLVTSPHIGGLSHESILRMTVSATTSVLAVLAGECPETVINPEVLHQAPSQRMGKK